MKNKSNLMGRDSYKSDKTLLEVLSDNCPMSDHIFDDIIEDYETTEEVAMELMASCKTGKFRRIDNKWHFDEL